MSSALESPLDESTDTLNNESPKAPEVEDATDWKSAMGTVTKLVSEFLASRVSTTSTGRADIVFEGLSVVGSGKGVRSLTVL